MATKKPSAKQLAARAKFVKMVRARAAAKKKAAPKKVAKKIGAYKKPKLFKPTKVQTAAAAKRLVKQAVKKPSTHKDTKSHNVNIRVVSGVKPRPTIVKLAKSIANDTQNNEHTKAVVKLATFLKNKDALQMLRAIDAAHKKYGHLPEPFQRARDYYQKECLQLAKMKLSGVDYDLIRSAY